MRTRTLVCGLLFFVTPALAKDKIKLMYLESEAEVRAAVMINRLDVPLEVHRIGVFRVGQSLYGVVRFGTTVPISGTSTPAPGGARAQALILPLPAPQSFLPFLGDASAPQVPGEATNRHRVGATVAMLSDRIFGELPDLVRIDFEGVSFRETKEVKPDVLFSASIDRGIWKTIPKTDVPLARVEAAGTLFFDEGLAMGQPLPVAKPPKSAKPAKAPAKPAKPAKAPAKAAKPAKAPAKAANTNKTAAKTGPKANSKARTTPASKVVSEKTATRTNKGKGESH